MENKTEGAPASPFTTAADAFPPTANRGEPTPGLSQSPGLREVPNSLAPAMADGTLVPHVYGPGQAAVDPIAAGLDTGYMPPTRNDDRVVTQTGVDGAGPRPSTYLEKGLDVPQSTVADHRQVRAPNDAAAETVLGPSAAPLEAAPVQEIKPAEPIPAPPAAPAA